MEDQPVMLITGARKGIGRGLAEHYLSQGYRVVGCSRSDSDLEADAYQHFSLDVADENSVIKMFGQISRKYRCLDILVNNAGVASMNHIMLTPGQTVDQVMDTNVKGSFLILREAAKLMLRRKQGRIVNMTTVAEPLRLEGEAIYAASKAAIESLTRITSRELGGFGITVNALGPTPLKTDLIAGVPEEKLQELLKRQAISRYALMEDVINVVDFYISPASEFITGQVIYLGGVN